MKIIREIIKRISDQLDEHDCFFVSRGLNPKCACGDFLYPRPNWTSQDYDKRYQAIRKCPIHSKVSNKETRRYERSVKYRVKLRLQKDMAYFPAFGIIQAVYLGKTGQVGIKAIDTNVGYRVVSTFPTREDARLYLINVIKTVKREQRMGIRTKRNLDPKYSGGLDFFIAPVYIVAPKRPLLGRGWKLPQPKGHSEKL